MRDQLGALGLDEGEGHKKGKIKEIRENRRPHLAGRKDPWALGAWRWQTEVQLRVEGEANKIKQNSVC